MILTTTGGHPNVLPPLPRPPGSTKSSFAVGGSPRAMGSPHHPMTSTLYSARSYHHGSSPAGHLMFGTPNSVTGSSSFGGTAPRVGPSSKSSARSAAHAFHRTSSPFLSSSPGAAVPPAAALGASIVPPSPSMSSQPVEQTRTFSHRGPVGMISSSRVDHSQQVILGERVIEHEVRYPKRVIVEDIVEKLVVVPETRRREELTEEVGRCFQKIVEVAKPIIQEKIVEIPEYEYVEKIVEVPEVIVQEKIREVPRIEYQERIIEIPRIIQQEKLVEVPEIEYREIPIEKIVEVPEIREQVVLKEVPVPQYVERAYPQYVNVEETVDLKRCVPIPVESITTYEFKLPMIRPQWTSVDIPLYIPRFVEIPFPLECMDVAGIHQADFYAQQVAQLGVASTTSLCELEHLARQLRSLDLQTLMSGTDIATSLFQGLQSGRVQITGTPQTISSYTDASSFLQGSTSFAPPISSHHLGKNFLYPCASTSALTPNDVVLPVIKSSIHSDMACSTQAAAAIQSTLTDVLTRGVSPAQAVAVVTEALKSLSSSSTSQMSIGRFQDDSQHPDQQEDTDTEEDEETYELSSTDGENNESINNNEELTTPRQIDLDEQYEE